MSKGVCSPLLYSPVPEVETPISRMQSQRKSSKGRSLSTTSSGQEKAASIEEGGSGGQRGTPPQAKAGKVKTAPPRPKNKPASSPKDQVDSPNNKKLGKGKEKEMSKDIVDLDWKMDEDLALTLLRRPPRIASSSTDNAGSHDEDDEQQQPQSDRSSTSDHPIRAPSSENRSQDSSEDLNRERMTIKQRIQSQQAMIQKHREAARLRIQGGSEVASCSSIDDDSGLGDHATKDPEDKSNHSTEVIPKTVEQPVEKSPEQPVDKPVERPSEELVENTTEKSELGQEVARPVTREKSAGGASPRIRKAPSRPARSRSTQREKGSLHSATSESSQHDGYRHEVEKKDNLLGKIQEAQLELDTTNSLITRRERDLLKASEPTSVAPKTIDIIVPSTKSKTYKKYKKSESLVIPCQQIAQNWLARNRLQKLDLNKINEYLQSEETKEGRLRIKMMQELSDTEETYVSSLQSTIDNYYNPLKTSLLVSEVELETIFSDLEIITDLSKIILAKIQARATSDQNGRHLRRSSTYYEDLLSVCDEDRTILIMARYIRRFNKAMDQLAYLKSSNPEFAQFLKEHQKTQLSLEAFLVMPVQRLPRYEMLLKGLLQHTPESHVDYPHLVKAVQAVTEVNVYINKRQIVEDSKQDLQWLLKALDTKKVQALGKKTATQSVRIKTKMLPMELRDARILQLTRVRRILMGI